MSMPFYVPPEQMMKDRADYARKGIARGRSLVAFSATDGIVIVAENAYRTLHKVGEILGALATRRGWRGASGFVAANAFVLLLMAVFFLAHPFDDHRRIRIAARSLRPEIFWPVILLLWVLAITVSQGNAAKFIYFDF